MDASRPVSTELDMTAKRVPLVEAACITEVHGMHSSWKHAFSDLDNQVVMRRHKTEGDALPLRSCRCARELAEELDSIDVIAKVSLRCPNAMGEDVE